MAESHRQRVVGMFGGVMLARDPSVDGSWCVDLLWSLPSTAAHLRRPEPVSRLAEGHPKGLALTRARTAPSLGCRGQGSWPRCGHRGVSPCRARRSRRRLGCACCSPSVPGLPSAAAPTPRAHILGGIAGCSVLEGVAGGRICCVRDTELYRHLLGLVGPWEVNRVELSVDGGRVDMWVEHPRRTRLACPGCECELAVYDHAEQRAWRHLDSCAFLTFLHASPPRVRCPEHGVRQVRLPWAEPHSRFTTLFERLAIDVLAACDVAAAAGLLRVSWDEAWHLLDRAV